MKNRNSRQRGTVMVEYALLLAGILVVGAAATSLLGHKTADLIGTAAVIMPGAHEDGNGPIVAGRAIETTSAEDGPITLDVQAISDATATARLATNLGMNAEALEALIVEPGEE